MMWKLKVFGYKLRDKLVDDEIDRQPTSSEKMFI